MTDNSKKSASVPSWQQAAASETPDESKQSSNIAGAEPDDLVDVARQFLDDDAIRDAPREEKVEFLKEKGLSAEAIEKLLAEPTDSSTELKTIHDTSSLTSSPQNQSDTGVEAVKQTVHQTKLIEQKSDMPPIITYPEFLLKPQKPPPLITVSRLVNAAYAIAAVSTLTWATSRYIIDPMLQSLTEARHDLAGTAIDDLERLNDKLEGVVSHVPYIATSAVKRQQDFDEDTESLDSDPTELFHRDIATQTSPGLSRSSSAVSLTRHTLDPTIAQSERLSGLSYSLRSLVQSLEHANDNEKYLRNTVQDLQQKLDTLESSYSLLKNDYYGPYSSASGDSKKTTHRENEAQKFKQEIRALKGAFLSSKNFPTASRLTTSTGGYGSR